MKDDKIEQFLSDIGCVFHYDPAIPLDKIIETSTSQSRRGLDASWVDRYAGLMKDGTEFPAIIVADFGKSLYALEQGLHRTAAAREIKAPTTDGYIVERPTKAQEQMLQLFDNPTSSLPMDTAERDAALIRMVVDEESVTLKDAAARVGLPRSHAEKVVQRAKNRRTLETAGVAAEDLRNLSATDIKNLSNLHDPVIIKIIDDAKKTGNMAGLSKTVAKVRKGKSDDEQLAIAQQEADRLAPERKATVQGRFKLSSKLQSLRKALDTINESDPESITVSARDAGTELFEQFRQELATASQQLARLLEATSEAKN